MNESVVTFQGWMGNDPEVRKVGTAEVASFRVASTPRRYNRRENTWADGETTWFTVNAWRALATNCAGALRKGEPVVVSGRLTCQVYEDEQGNPRQTSVVEATFVGHDLNKGTTLFTRTTPGSSEPADDTEIKRLNAELGVGGPQVSSDGETIEDMVATG